MPFLNTKLSIYLKTKSMKKIMLVNMVLLLSIILLNCGLAPEPEPVKMNLPENYSTQTNTFTFDFLKNLENEEPQNFFVSPMSLHVALGMLLNGADGKTKDEIQNTLKLTGDLTQININYRELMEKLPQLDTKVTNTIANSVWHSNKFTVKSTYTQALRDYFKASISAEDFTKKATVDKINTWANINTNGKIDKVIDEITPEQVMFLMNALYFKGDWKTPFKTENTHDADFVGSTGKKTVKMMNMTEDVNYVTRSGYKAIELPYGNGVYAMTILLPDANKSIKDLSAILSASEWQALKKDTTKQKVMVGLPKFTLTYEKNLNAILSKMGMPTAFTNAADFSKMAITAEILKVGFVKQNAFLAIDEKGTEAAAVTTIGVVTTSMPVYPEFICNRPFFFMITEKQGGNILFVGKVVSL